MKLLASVVLVAAVASSTFAQNIAIGAPTAGSSVLAGKKLVVEVDRPVSSEILLSFYSNNLGFQRTRSLAPKKLRLSLR